MDAFEANLTLKDLLGKHTIGDPPEPCEDESIPGKKINATRQSKDDIILHVAGFYYRGSSVA
jgi:hypothetical protein